MGLQILFAQMYKSGIVHKLKITQYFLSVNLVYTNHCYVLHVRKRNNNLISR